MTTFETPQLPTTWQHVPLEGKLYAALWNLKPLIAEAGGRYDGPNVLSVCVCGCVCPLAVTSRSSRRTCRLIERYRSITVEEAYAPVSTEKGIYPNSVTAAPKAVPP